MSNSVPSDRRIHAIDAVRGLCLLNIFVNHVTLGILHELSPSKIGFCDSADIFVFLAGISAFLAYGRASQEFDFGEARRRMWRRAGQLYLFNVGILAASFIILVTSAAIAPMARPELSPEAVASSAGWLTYLWHVLTFQQSIGFSMVLRLYVFLLIVGPIYVWLAARRYWYPLIPAALVWLIAGQFGLAESDSLTGEPLSMTFLPWNLVFAAGISLGAAIRQRVALPSSPILRHSALAVVVGGTLVMTAGGYVSPDVFAWLDDAQRSLLDRHQQDAAVAAPRPLPARPRLSVYRLCESAVGQAVSRPARGQHSLPVGPPLARGVHLRRGLRADRGQLAVGPEPDGRPAAAVSRGSRCWS